MTGKTLLQIVVGCLFIGLGALFMLPHVLSYPTLEALFYLVVALGAIGWICLMAYCALDTLGTGDEGWGIMTALILATPAVWLLVSLVFHWLGR